MPKVNAEQIPPIVVGYVEQLLGEFTHPSTRSNSYAMLHNIETYVSQALAEYRANESKGEYAVQKHRSLAGTAKNFMKKD